MAEDTPHKCHLLQGNKQAPPLQLFEHHPVKAVLDFTKLKGTFPLSSRDKLLRSKDSSSPPYVVNFPKIHFLAPQQKFLYQNPNLSMLSAYDTPSSCQSVSVKHQQGVSQNQQVEVSVLSCLEEIPEQRNP